MIDRGIAVRALNVLKPCEALGVNTPVELAAVEAVVRGHARQGMVA